MKLPLISVVIPVLNCEKYVADAVSSILAQDYHNLEIIVVNDGSTDNTLSVLEKFGTKIKIISQNNQGQAVARNVGLRLTLGSIIGLLDADDMWPPNHIELALPYLEKDKYDLVRGLTKYVRDSRDGEESTKDLFMEALVGACLYKRQVFDIVGLFDEQMRQGEDFDWNIRLRETNCKEKRLDQTMLFYRRHGSNLTNSQEFVKRGQLEAFRKKIERQRSKAKSLS